MAYDVESSELVYDGDRSRIRMDQVRMPDGSVAGREIVEHDDAVAVVAVDAEQRVVLIRHFRHAVRSYLTEIPAGKLDVAGEDRAEAARRELQEEVGLDAAELVELTTFHNSCGWTTETTTVYLGTGLTEVAAPEGFTATAEEADLTIERVPLADAAGQALRGGIPDAKTLVGLVLAAHRLGIPPA